MDYRIVERGAFRVVGKTKRISTKDGENLKLVPQFWRDCMDDQTLKRVAEYNQNNAWLGICLDMDMENEQFSYMIAVESEQTPQNAELDTRTIPASTWAVFTSAGPIPGAIQEVWQRIYQEWFPATGYEHAGTAELEVYPPGDNSAADYRCEVWIPIVKK